MKKHDDEVTETTAMLGNEEEDHIHIGRIEAWSRGGLTNKCGG